MEWKDVMIPALETTSLVLLCLVWFMIGKYRALSRKQKSDLAAAITSGVKPCDFGINLIETDGETSREVQMTFDASMDNAEIVAHMEAMCWEHLCRLHQEVGGGVRLQGEIKI